MKNENFEAIAMIINGQFKKNENFEDRKPNDVIRDIMIDMASYFQDENPNFEHGKFFNACRLDT